MEAHFASVCIVESVELVGDVSVSFQFSVSQAKYYGRRGYSKKCGDDIFDEQTKKRFIIYLAKSSGGKSAEDPRPKCSYIKPLWKQFTAEWARRKGKLPSLVTHSGTMLGGLSFTIHRGCAMAESLLYSSSIKNCTNMCLSSCRMR
jgi:hypothetical protein